MINRDLIQDARHIPTYEEILNYMDEHTQSMWKDMNFFIQNVYNTLPKTMYSKCSGKPGWNVMAHDSSR